MMRIYRSVSLLLILVISGMFVISNLAAVNMSGGYLTHIEMGESLEGEVYEQGSMVCQDACGVVSSVSCVKHCELTHAVVTYLPVLLMTHQKMNPEVIYRQMQPEPPVLVELKPPKLHIV